MLARAEKAWIAERVYRVTQPGSRWSAIHRLHQELGDGREFAEALDFLESTEPLGPADLFACIANAFRPPFRSGRFSDGSYGVLYTARQYRTANKEYAYWSKKGFNPTLEPYKIKLQLISIQLRGFGKDLRRFVTEFPWLVDDDHTRCQALGSAARQQGLQCLIAPSARDRPKGATIPIFDISSVSGGRQDAVVTFTIRSGKPTTFKTHRI